MMNTVGSVSSLEAHLGYWLRFVSNQVSHAFNLKLAAHDVTVAEWVFMRDLFDAEAIAPNKLAERLGMTRGAISKLADRLVAKGLIAREESEGDRRSQRLVLTDPARTLLPILAALADENDKQFFGHLDPATWAAIETAMKDIVKRQGIRTIPVA